MPLSTALDVLQVAAAGAMATSVTSNVLFPITEQQNIIISVVGSLIMVVMFAIRRRKRNND